MKNSIETIMCDMLGLSSAFVIMLLPLWVFWWFQWQNSLDVITSNIIHVFGIYIIFFIAYVSWKLKKELPHILVYKVLPIIFTMFSSFVLIKAALTLNIYLAFSGIEARLYFGIEPLSILTWGIFATVALFFACKKTLTPTNGLAFVIISFLFISNIWQLPEEYDFLFYNWSWYFAGLSFFYLLYRFKWKPTLLFTVNMFICLATFAVWQWLPAFFLRVPFAFIPLTILQEMKK